MRSQQKVVLLLYSWLITVLFMAFSPVWVYSYLKRCVKNGTIRWRNKQAVLTLKAQSDKQTATRSSSPLWWPCGCECCVSCLRQARSLCYLPLYHPHFWQLTLFRKPQLAFSPTNKTLQMWAALTLDPSSLSFHLLRQFSVTNSPESRLSHSVSQVMRRAFERDARRSSCNESIHGRRI